VKKLEQLKVLDGLRTGTLGARPCLIHNDHRWLLPIICSAQEAGLIPRPVTVVMFDFHPDDLEPLCMDEIKQLRQDGPTVEALIELCQSRLRSLDDDWVIAGMELGLIDHIVTFGVDDRFDCKREHRDHLGHVHYLEYPELPRGGLGYQGSLSDLAKDRELSRLWTILGWRHFTGMGFQFDPATPKILLDFDLDCFAVRWRDYLFPWPDEVFEREFLEPSGYWTVEGRTGQDFVHGLISKAGLVTIAREPNHCGGDEKADEILRKLNRYVFDGQLTF
jgi:hypothetical protein